MITKDMIIGDVISEHPELVRTFFANGMMCIGCPTGSSTQRGTRIITACDPVTVFEK